MKDMHMQSAQNLFSDRVSDISAYTLLNDIWLHAEFMLLYVLLEII